jgi:LAO/AO transport system kinase
MSLSYEPSRHALTRRDLARLITRIENGEPIARQKLDALYKHGGRARVIGVTGAPGSGKSTLVAELGRALRALPAAPQVGIIAVDPSSPFSGGAILGDRIRMRDLFGDPGVFIRSMASRGALGGIAIATADVVTAMDASGFDVIIVETVGAGQLEVDVAGIAQTVIVVEAPGAGDEVQAVKAGILEIADIVVVNKADREGVSQTVSALRSALDVAVPATSTVAHAGRGHTAGVSQPIQVQAWQPPILKVSALNREGIGDLLAALDRHAQYLAESGEGQRRMLLHLDTDIQARLREMLLQQALHRIPPKLYQQLLSAAVRRELHPAEAARQLLETLEP